MNADIPGRLFDVQPGDVVITVLPLFHVFGLSSILDICVRFGCTMSLLPRYTPGAVLTAMARDRVTIFEGVPTKISHHVRHVTVPAPGGDVRLRAVAAKLLARRLDLSLPLWEEWFLTGLADGRWAIVSKVHHCMADGIGGNDLMTLVFDTDPEAQLPEPVGVPMWLALGTQAAYRFPQPLVQTTTSPVRAIRSMSSAGA